MLSNQITELCAKSKLFSHNHVPVNNEHLDKWQPCLKSVYLTLSDKCNLKCKYCYTEERLKAAISGIDEWKLYIDKALQVSSKLTFVFTGGEPLLCSFIFELAKHIKDNGSTSILLTNGTCINNKEIAKNISKYFTETRISLDSNDDKINSCLRGEGVLKQVESALVLLEEADANYIVQATVTTINKDNLLGFANKFNNRVNFQPLYPKGAGRYCSDLSISGLEYFKALSRAGISPFKRNIHSYRCNPVKRCSMANGEISIGPNGDLYPCHMLHYPQFKIGNLKGDDFEVLYSNSPILKELRNLNVDRINECRKCEVRNFCGGACRARLDIQKDGLDGKDPFCVYEKESILEALLYSYG